ncbi:MAG: hypothetical protein ACXVCP_18855 [Bdellovibrio sp.]
MKSSFLLLAFLLNATIATASTLNEICKEHTKSPKSYNICVANASANDEQLAICADFALLPGNTQKTTPFKNCLKVSEQRQLSLNSIKYCGESSGTHKGFSHCLNTIEASSIPD